MNRRSLLQMLGVGMAMYVEGTGPGPYEGGHIRIETDASDSGLPVAP